MAENFIETDAKLGRDSAAGQEVNAIVKIDRGSAAGQKVAATVDATVEIGRGSAAVQQVDATVSSGSEPFCGNTNHFQLVTEFLVPPSTATTNRSRKTPQKAEEQISSICSRR